MSSLIVRPVETPRDWSNFAKFKNSIYLDSLNNRSQTREDMKKLQAFSKKHANNQATLFLAEKKGQILGRIAALYDEQHNSKEEGFFGFFESVEEPMVAEALLQKAAEELFGWGKKQMLGPISPSTNDRVGIITAGFDVLPHPSLNYNPPYYQKLLEQAGLTKSMELLSYLWTKDAAPPKHFSSLIMSAIKKHEVSLYYPAKYSPKKEAPGLLQLYNQSLNQNWGYVPLTLEEAEEILFSYKRSGIADFLFYLVIDGEFAGLVIIQPNLHRYLTEESTKVRVAVMGLKPKFRQRGLSSILILKTIDFLQSHNYATAEVSLIMANNDTVRGLLEKTLNYPILHRYQVYQCELPACGR
ncbi:MAG: GNAT family N-acetyltransferase [Bacillota bacterium]